MSDSNDASFAERVQAINRKLTTEVYQYVQYSTFNVHKLTVKTLFTLKAMVNEGEASEEDVEHFLSAPDLVDAPYIPETLRSFL